MFFVIFMYFTHFQLRPTRTNLKRIILAFLKKADEKKLERELSFYFPKKDFVFTDMGRTAFRLIIEKFDLKNSDMLVPSYICDIFLPIFKQYNIKPIFLDADPDSFNIKTEEIKRKITKNTKSILVCHTYGAFCDVEKIKKALPKKQNILIIEDCSHAFGLKTKGKYAGNFGDVAFLSIYKQFPTLRGGLFIAPKTKEEKNENIKFKETQFTLRDFISLLNCFSFFSFVFRKTASSVAPRLVKEEKRKTKIAKLNRVSKNLFLFFLQDFKKRLRKRIKTANILKNELETIGFKFQKTQTHIYTYLSALCPQNINRDVLHKRLKKKGVFVTRIWHHPLVFAARPKSEKRFPKTKEISQRIINFPLQDFYTKEDTEKIIKSIKETVEN